VGAGIYDTIQEEKKRLYSKTKYLIIQVTELFLLENKVICKRERNQLSVSSSSGIQLDWDKIKGLKETFR
jgi:sulfide:quinone oxidoreductase